MMAPHLIIDAGVLTGLIRKRDQWNIWSRQAAAEYPGPYRTCEPAITEAAFLLGGAPESQQRLLEMIESGALRVDFSLSPEIDAVRALMRKYRDVPMSLADACLVRMSEIYDDASVFTVDSDFLVYRKHGRKKIPLVSPF